jgi:N-acetylneuraminic acid mutarotase
MKRRKKYRKSKCRKMHRRSRNPKLFREQYGIGKTKYSVSFHNGVSKHKDGSPFYDIRLFKNKRKKDQFIRSLLKQGYRERSWNENPDGLKCRSCGKKISILNAVKSGGTLHCTACVKRYKLKRQKMW